MSSIPVFEAKTRLSELLVQAQQGAVITITRHGVPMARLVAAEPESDLNAAAGQQRRVASAFKSLAALRQGVTLDIPLRDAIGQGRD